MNALAKLVFYTHILMIFIIVFGWLLPLNFLKFHLILIPTTIIQWWFNSNQCVLTQWQHKLERRTLCNDEEGTFIKALFRRLDIEPSEKMLFFFIYGLMFISFSLSLLRISLMS